MFLINFWCNSRLERGVSVCRNTLLERGIYMYGVRRGLWDCWSSSFKFSGLGIRQFSVYVILCNLE